MNAYECISCQINHNASKANDGKKTFDKFLITCGDSTKQLEYLKKYSTKWRSLYSHQSQSHGFLSFDFDGMQYLPPVFMNMRLAEDP